MASRLLFILLAILSLINLSVCTDIGGKFIAPKGKEKFVNFNFNSISVVLEGETEIFKTYVYPNGLFKFTNIPEGIYIMKIADIENIYDLYAVEVLSSKGKFIPREYIISILRIFSLIVC